MDLVEMAQQHKQQQDECKLRQYLKTLPPEKRNEPVMFSCNCKRCLPSM